MVEGTRMKQLETCLDALEMGLPQNQEQLEDKLDMMELGLRQT